MAEEIKKTEPAKKPQNEGKSRVGLTVAVLALIIIVQGVKIFLDYEEKLDLREEKAMEESEHAATMQRLSEISQDLDMKIEELEKLGGDITELENAKAEIEKELTDTRRRNRNAINRLQNKVDGYEELLVAKDQEIQKLAKLNEQLYSENNNLKTEKNQLNRTIVELNEEQSALQGKINIASKLEVENIAVIAIDSRGKEHDSPFRKRHAKQLKVTFNMAKNDVAPIEGKDIIVRVIDPQGNIIFDVAKGSGTFFYEGKEEFFTAKQNILFDNTQQKLTFYYEKGTDYEEGNYSLEVYTDEYKMGTAAFEIK